MTIRRCANGGRLNSPIAVLNLVKYYPFYMAEEKIINVNGVDYIASSDGKIFSTKNVGRGKYHKELKQRKNQDGYWCVTVGTNKNRTAQRVHRIIALAFVPNPYNLPEVDHIDNDRENNNASNLQWMNGIDNKRKTPFERRSITHSGELNGRAKLTIKDVKAIRQMYTNGYSKQEIATKYGRGWSTIHNIIIENTWKGI